MTIKNLDNRVLGWVKAAVFLIALLPLAKLAAAAYADDLGANPIEKITHVTGYWALTFLLITLAVTPLRRLSGWLWLMRLRRMLGLFAFFYAVLHFSTYLVLDQFFDWDAIDKDIVKRPYITIGFSAFILLIPLALTSNDAMIQRLGGKRWRALHSLIYPCAIAGVVHFCWLVKKDLTRPFMFAALLGLLLGLRMAYRFINSRKRKQAVHEIKQKTA
ncbi:MULTISPECIES: sulfite oxidase heme-binding subunit YedZ [Methylomonas]|uniref:Protein-methionine-sulfoxide reductase heme-binding subunit MsrQ n=2 Tax=Methylomonas TaxID=416 RepID=A0A126T4Q7_9GAMM|nr:MULTISPECIES: protein-methionine-sulfoxide reductase heme-binding subunit MsrQ [Methylomonas]AMK77073.1 sulfoxide reductase heme-binding subunit YedZ [Methylomonas denitrificans]OAH97180.1 sulfoxide reductase heme-binding subunit YedZ [Methylomonas methanica]TCV82576.1 sulfoxide reductase heme-binding subunit YedZ [Methylomonas methanica]